MYIPQQFDVTDRAWVAGLIERHPFGLLVTNDAPYPRISHIPLLAELKGEELRLIGHVARANPHARSIADGAAAALVIEGPHAYVSASWYEEPYATVPTWNYVAAHVCGRLENCDAWRAVRLLSERAERANGTEWQPDRLDRDYRDGQLRAIVAFELRAETIYAKAKLSQNRTETDRQRVIARLSESADQNDRACAEAMRAELIIGRSF